LGFLQHRKTPNEIVHKTKDKVFPFQAMITVVASPKTLGAEKTEDNLTKEHPHQHVTTFPCSG
jgi:hypothetical protein